MIRESYHGAARVQPQPADGLDDTTGRMAAPAPIPSAEVLLAAAVLTWPSESEKALSIIGREDFGDPRLFDVIADVARDPDAPLPSRAGCAGTGPGSRWLR